MPEIGVRRVDFSEIVGLRERFRAEARCQIVRDSILPRGLADPFVLLVDGAVGGYAGVWNEHFPDRIAEFFLLPERRPAGLAALRALQRFSGAKELEAQTNLPDGESLLRQCAPYIWTEHLLFEEGAPARPGDPGGTFRRRQAADPGPEGEWVIEVEGRVVGAGGVLTHYNPPYADLYMEVVEGARGRGTGSQLVRELRLVCADRGLKAAARCGVSNLASRRTLERGGMVLCGRLIAGTLSQEGDWT